MIFGDKLSFAVELERLRCQDDAPWASAAIWLSGHRLGRFSEYGDFLYSFLRTLWRLALMPEQFYDVELQNLRGADLVYRTDPFFDYPEGFYDADDEMQESLLKYDKYLLGFGSDFDGIFLKPFAKNQVYEFVWLPGFKHRVNDSYRELIRSTTVPQEEVVDVYRKVCAFVPKHYWPENLERI